MKKKLISHLLILCLLCSLLPAAALTAKAATYSGTCGNNLTWTLDSDTGALTISGTGAMTDYTYDRVPWYPYRHSVKNVIIENNVTSIGRDAFYDCSSLTSVAIPDSVTSIADDAFLGCESLTGIWVPDGNTKYSSDNSGVLFNKNQTTLIQCPGGFTGSYTIPDSVTSIGDYAFWDCISLTSVTIPDSVTSIGNNAFCRCSSLTSVTIPDGVTSIGSGAFSDCSSLTSVAIPDGVTSIESSAFFYCNSLTSVTIPDSVTSIDGYAFWYCSSLTSVTIPDGVTSIGRGAFSDCSSLSSVTILNPSCSIINEVNTLGVPGTTNIYGYEGSSAQTYANAYGFDFVAFGTVISNNQRPVTDIPWLLNVVDRESKQGISGTTLSLYSGSSITTLTTDAEGIAEGFYGLGTAVTVVSKEGYRNIIREQGALSSSAVCFLLEKGTANDFYVASASLELYSNKEPKDARNEQIVVDLKEAVYYGVGRHKLTAYINTNGKEVSKVVLKQGDREFLMDISTKYGFTLAKLNLPDVYGDLVPNQAVYLYAVATDGTVSDAYKLSLKLIDGSSNVQETEMFQTDEEGNIVSFKLGQETSVTLPDNIPVFGGAELSLLKMDWCPVKTEVDEDGTVTIAIGIVDLEEDENGEIKNKFFNLDSWVEEFKKSKKAYANANEAINGMKLRANLFKSSFALWSDEEYTVKDGVKSNLDMYGFFRVNAEGDLLEGGIMFSAKVKYTYQGQSFIGYIPVYYEVGGGFGASFEGTFVEWDDEGFRATMEGQIEAELSGKIGGGVGIAKVFTVGVWGEAKLTYTVDFPDFHTLLKLKGGAGLEVKVLGSTVASTDWLDSAGAEIEIYEDPKSEEKNESKTVTTATSNVQIFDSLDYMQKVDPVSRDYISETSKWFGSVTNAKRSSTGASQNITLQTNIYTDAEPILMETEDGSIVLLWLSDNTERDAINRTMLVYSVYDSESETWTAPTAVCDDGFADFYPAVSGDFVVWHKSSATFTNESTLEDMAQNSEIYLSRWNGECFDSAVALTCNSIMDTTPTVFDDGDTATIAWVRNSNNNIFGNDSANSIIMATYSDGTVSDETVIADGVNAVTELSSGRIGNTLCIAYVLEEDNDLNTTADWEIYLYSDSSVAQLTDNELLDSNPVFSNISGNDSLYWYAGGDIVCCNESYVVSTVLTAEDYAANDDFQIIGNGENVCVLWPRADSSYTIWGAHYEAGNWTAATELMSGGTNIAYPSSVMLADGRIMTAYNNVTECYDEEGVHTWNTADLCVLTTERFAETKLCAIYVDESGFLSEAKATIYAEINNTGTTELNSLNVTVIESDGTVIYDETVECCLGLNETKTISLECMDQGSIEKKDWTIYIAADNETNTTDNSNTVSIGCADVRVRCVTKNTSSTYALVVGELTNIGAETATGIEVSLVSVDGTVIDTMTVEDLGAGDATVVSFRLCHPPGSVDNEELYLRVKAENDLNESNNEAYAVLPYSLIESCKTHTWDSGVVVKDATCEEEGETLYTCVLCVAQKREKVEILHTCVYSNNGANHNVTCTSCGYSATEDHTYVDGSCICGAAETVIPAEPTQVEIKISHTVSFDSDLKMNYRIKYENIAAAIPNYVTEGAYLVVEKDQYLASGEFAVDTVTLYPDLETDPTRMLFNLGGIQSVEMGSELRAVLHIFDAEGNEYVTPVDAYSILDYAQLFYDTYTYEQQPELYAMLIDALNYGSAAQIYFGRRADVLVNAGMDAYQQYATTELSAPLEDSKVTETNDRSITAVSKIGFSVTFSDKTEMNARLTIADGYSKSDITSVKVLDAEGKVVDTLTDFVELADGRLQVTYYGVKSVQMRDRFYFVAYVGDQVASDNVGYSVEAYAKGNVGSSNTALANMVLNCIYYGDSAYAYFNR